MNIGINKKSDIYIKPFVNYLLGELKLLLKSSIDRNKCSAFDNYFKSIGLKESTYSLLIKSVNHLKIREYSSYFVIEFDAKIYKNTLSYEKIAKIVNYGVDNINCYNIFEEIFKKVVDNLDSYYLIFKEIV